MTITKKLRELERGPLPDVWRSTLSQVATLFGRMVYLNSLRSTDTGRYIHHGLTDVYGDDESSNALMQSHEETFARWLSSSLEQQKGDLDLYIAGLQTPPSTVIETWLVSRPYLSVVPYRARRSERELFGCDFEALLELLRREYMIGRPDPEDS